MSIILGVLGVHATRLPRRRRRKPPSGLAGLLSPLGACRVGTIDVPLTREMIHIWIVPGAPEPFGDLDEAWKRAYLQAIAVQDSP